MDGNIQDRATKDASARRRLIRGAFSAPAVMTLYSGSAFAATSNIRCVSNQISNPSFPGVGPADTWLRVQRYKLRLNSSPTPPCEYWVRGVDVVALRGTNTAITTYLATNQFHKLGTSPIFTTSTAPTSGGRGLEIDTGNWVAVRVDVNGNIVGIVEGTASGSSAVANSCWSSFRIGAG